MSIEVTAREGVNPLDSILVFAPGEKPDLCAFVEVGKLKTRELGQECFIKNDITEKAKTIAVKKVAARFKVTEEQAIEQFDICVMSGNVCWDYVLARRKI